MVKYMRKGYKDGRTTIKGRLTGDSRAKVVVLLP